MPSSSNSKMSMFDLERQLVFYASYHNHPVNILIHLLCIWNIAWTTIFLLQLTPALAGLADVLPVASHLKVNLALAVVALYCVVYIFMEPLVGTIGSVLLVLIYYQTSLWASTPGQLLLGFPVVKFVWSVWVGSWLLQFIGHGVFEGRAPALLDSWDQALITAPLFVLLELAFFCGYRRQFYAKCMKQVEENIRQFKAKQS